MTHDQGERWDESQRPHRPRQALYRARSFDGLRFLDRYAANTDAERDRLDRAMIGWGNILAETAFNFHRGYDTDAIYRAMRGIRKG